MNILFFVLNAVLAVPGKTNDELWVTLEKYQNITGISNEVKTMIWQKAADIRAGLKQGYFYCSTLRELSHNQFI